MLRSAAPLVGTFSTSVWADVGPAELSWISETLLLERGGTRERLKKRVHSWIVIAQSCGIFADFEAGPLEPRVAKQLLHPERSQSRQSHIRDRLHDVLGGLAPTVQPI